MRTPRWTLEAVEYPAEPAEAVRRLAAHSEIAWLDSAATAQRGHSGGISGVSMICWSPAAVLEQAATGPARFSHGAKEMAHGWRLWESLHRELPRLAAPSFGIAPGWVGYVGFETAGQLERLPARHTPNLGLPLMRLGLYDAGVVLDHVRREAWLLHTDALRPILGAAETEIDDRRRQWIAACQTSLPEANKFADPLRLTAELSQPAYERMVRRALEYIRAGDIYQVNLAQRLQIVGVDDILAAYARIRRQNPADYAALLHWPGGAVASFSPELMLQLRGREVLTRPIKGTRPRTGIAAVDRAYEADLLASAKDAAELAMIVDLHRNDLGRVCEYGSVRVSNPRGLERHPTVVHTVADVVGRVRGDCDVLDLLRASFPAGSITGAPKLRAIEIIDELEPCARGVFTGAIGVLGLDGNLTFNVAIRTLQHRGNRATLHVGGGIVADSVPSDEYDETLAKARGILAGLGFDSPESSLAPTRSPATATQKRM